MFFGDKDLDLQNISLSFVFIKYGSKIAKNFNYESQSYNNVFLCYWINCMFI